VCILLAVSRASFANYFILFYFYALITHQKLFIKVIHYAFLFLIVLLIFIVKGDLLDFAVDTLQFQNASSIGHLIEWMKGLQAMSESPLGLGLGASGRVSMETNDNVGGENQLIIIGVQTGIPALLVYISIYYLLLLTGFRQLKYARGKKRRLIMAVLFLKIGMLIPLLTSYIDSFNYITYTINFLSGLMINVIMYREENRQELPNDVEAVSIK
jgi:hypothetical protein